MIDEAIGTRVCVHLNLTTKRWVVATKPKGTILGYADEVTLTDVTFKVSEAQRQYCLRKNGRWVHAWALGTLEAVGPADVVGTEQITYNPFRAPTFHVVGQERPVHDAKRVHFKAQHGYLLETA